MLVASLKKMGLHFWSLLLETRLNIAFVPQQVVYSVGHNRIEMHGMRGAKWGWGVGGEGGMSWKKGWSLDKLNSVGFDTDLHSSVQSF